MIIIDFTPVHIWKVTNNDEIYVGEFLSIEEAITKGKIREDDEIGVRSKGI